MRVRWMRCRNMSRASIYVMCSTDADSVLVRPTMPRKRGKPLIGGCVNAGGVFRARHIRWTYGIHYNKLGGVSLVPWHDVIMT
jgi:hypothetical protein